MLDRLGVTYMKGKEGFGLYHVGYGDLDAVDAFFVASSLTVLLERATGVNLL
jgi:hypothetical protein